jgi:hypothetical protein
MSRRTKLTRADIEAAARRHSAGASWSEIAESLGVSKESLRSKARRTVLKGTDPGRDPPTDSRGATAASESPKGGQSGHDGVADDGLIHPAHQSEGRAGSAFLPPPGSHDGSLSLLDPAPSPTPSDLVDRLDVPDAASSSGLEPEDEVELLSGAVQDLDRKVGSVLLRLKTIERRLGIATAGIDLSGVV